MIDACNDIEGIVLLDDDLDGNVDGQENIVGGLDNEEDIVGGIESDGEVSGVIDISDDITTQISMEGQIEGHIYGEPTIQGEVILTSCVEIPPYQGDYEVTPRTDEQSLPTKSKYMLDDVTVKAIPYYETHNDYGTTVYIAETI